MNGAGGGALRLVADIGGTNARFALAGADGSLAYADSLSVRDFASFEAALTAWLAGVGPGERARIASAAFAAAGPVDDGAVKLTNAPWRLAARDMAGPLGGIPTAIFNDLEAVAYALPCLGPGDTQAIGPVPPPPAASARRVAVNVGTGFGAATAIPAGSGWLACPSEAGHMTLAAGDAEEAALLRALAPGRSATLEDALSGAGVGALYAALSDGAAIEADAVFARVKTDMAARHTVETISRWLGRAAGDIVLATAAWGGAYLLGGVVGGWCAYCDARAFRAAFEDKGKMRARMRGVFSGALTRTDVALLGLAKAPIGGGDA